jgi:hypothetical protein
LYPGIAPDFRREARTPVTGRTDFLLEDGRRLIITMFEVAGGASGIKPALSEAVVTIIAHI